ncbi:MAG: hypothetical protein WC184_11850 [Acidimicrobiia bacterium]
MDQHPNQPEIPAYIWIALLAITTSIAAMFVWATLNPKTHIETDPVWDNAGTTLQKQTATQISLHVWDGDKLALVEQGDINPTKCDGTFKRYANNDPVPTTKIEFDKQNPQSWIVVEVLADHNLCNFLNKLAVTTQNTTATPKGYTSNINIEKVLEHRDPTRVYDPEAIKTIVTGIKETQLELDDHNRPVTVRFVSSEPDERPIIELTLTYDPQP